ncbi:MAG: hypothetical protein JW850_16800 [Thermoflexales bacterium]|nr:hypothetical protein [Thermoflexales bacterium]
MTIQQIMRQVEIVLPDVLYQWLYGEAKRRNRDVSTIVQAALECYAHEFDLIQTRTWELCGAFTVAEQETVYVLGTDESGAPRTNYAEHVDEVLVEDTHGRSHR